MENTLKDYTKIVVETDEENPTTIATVTSDDISVADGYRVRLTPDYEVKEMELKNTVEKFNSSPNNFIAMELLKIYGNTKSEEVKIRALEGLQRCTAHL